ncbi:Zinc finger, N-recognin [Metarhizium album ARSEF 1941]|uniref:Zinc finger, N-recognin n=1 Tax=Metarhizium album (strain ARSEF 1941) TaxID=1081103 RepID=A0A0B2WMP2_METAS|nr:Zinc finger, N-recognin [Metarhizium album ARSEF 1941]KHN95213.1 Zinc finger, N-recognin [Metarhizium album ARSEF 1941]
MSTVSPQDEAAPARSNSFSQQSQASDDSQTAAEFLRNQELLEADAREALPYSIECCTKILGPLRQNVFACLTCNPATEDPSAWKPAGVCYACSVQCHGEHRLVEIFQKRNFTCDCGTKRIPATSPCTLRTNEETKTKGNVHSEEPDVNNKYNQNFRNIFCGCECDYDPFQQKGTMFQCLGLGTHESGGCGEDWYHPGCLVGMGPRWFDKMPGVKRRRNGGALATISEGNEEQPEDAPADDADVAVLDDEDEPPMPPGFPDEDEFEGFLCYKCADANPWIKRYAGTSGFLPPVFLDPAEGNTATRQAKTEVETDNEPSSRKRKADKDVEEAAEAKRVKSEEQDSPSKAEPGKDSTPRAPEAAQTDSTQLGCKLPNLPAAPPGRFSLFFKEGFRDQLCRCTDCHGLVNAHPQLLEEEEVYEPPISEDGGSRHGGSTHGSGSLLERGESALRNVDRVRAIEGVMAYNHLKERLKPFFQQFAESGKAVGAEDIKAYFAKLRGDEQGIREAGQAAADSKDGEGGGDARREQSGY